MGIAWDAAGHFEAEVEETILRSAGRGSRTRADGVRSPTALLQITSPLLHLALLRSILWEPIHWSWELVSVPPFAYHLNAPSLEMSVAIWNFTLCIVSEPKQNIFIVEMREFLVSQLGQALCLFWDEFCQGLTLLRNPLCSAECWCCWETYNQIPVRLQCSILNDVAAFDLWSCLRTVAKCMASALTLLFRAVTAFRLNQITIKHFMKMYTKRNPSYLMGSFLLHWCQALPNPHSGTLKTPELCYFQRRTSEGWCVPNTKSELLCCVWFCGSGK